VEKEAYLMGLETFSIEEKVDLMLKKLEYLENKISANGVKSGKPKLFNAMRDDLCTSNGNRLKRIATAPYASIRNIADNRVNRFIRISTRYVKNYQDFLGAAQIIQANENTIFIVPERTSLSIWQQSKITQTKISYHSASIGFILPNEVNLGNFISAYCHAKVEKRYIKIDLNYVVHPKTGELVSMWDKYNQMIIGVN